MKQIWKSSLQIGIVGSDPSSKNSKSNLQIAIHGAPEVYGKTP